MSLVLWVRHDAWVRDTFILWKGILPHQSEHGSTCCLERTHIGFHGMGEHRNQDPVRIAQSRLSRLDKMASYNDNLILEDPKVVNFLTHLIRPCFEQCNVADSIFMRFSTLVLYVLLTKYIDVVLAGDEQKLRRIICYFTGMSLVLSSASTAC
jgi:hypothetical protein